MRSGSKFDVKGNLLNFSGTTLTGGTYNILGGTLQFNGANIVTNAANIMLVGVSSQIIDQSNANGLANFATNASGGSFNFQGGRNFTTIGNFTNAGNFTIGTGSTFTLGGLGNFVQTAGKLTDDGTLSTSGTVTLSGGNLFGTGLVKGALQSSAVITPGDSTTTTGILTDSGAFTQSAGGSLDISIGGTTAGSKFGELNSTTAALGGTLNIKLINGFVPALGTTFKVLNFSSETGQFATVNGLAINGTEHFTITYQGTDVLLTVISGAATTNAAVISNPAFSTMRPHNNNFLGGTTGLINSLNLVSGSSRMSPIARAIIDQPHSGGQAQSGNLYFRLVSASFRLPAAPRDVAHPVLASAGSGFRLEHVLSSNAAVISNPVFSTMRPRNGSFLASGTTGLINSLNLVSRLSMTNPIARAIIDQPHFSGQVLSGSLYLRPISTSLRLPVMPIKVDQPVLASAGSGFRLGHTLSFPQIPTGAKLRVIVTGGNLSSASANFLSRTNYSGSRFGTNLYGRGRLGTEVASGTMQFSLTKLFSKPSFHFAVE